MTLWHVQNISNFHDFTFHRKKQTAVVIVVSQHLPQIQTVFQYFIISTWNLSLLSVCIVNVFTFSLRMLHSYIWNHNLAIHKYFTRLLVEMNRCKSISSEQRGQGAVTSKGSSGWLIIDKISIEILGYFLYLANIFYWLEFFWSGRDFWVLLNRMGGQKAWEPLCVCACVCVYVCVGTDHSSTQCFTLQRCSKWAYQSCEHQAMKLAEWESLYRPAKQQFINVCVIHTKSGKSTYPEQSVCVCFQLIPTVHVVVWG